MRTIPRGVLALLWSFLPLTAGCLAPESADFQGDDRVGGFVGSGSVLAASLEPAPSGTGVLTVPLSSSRPFDRLGLRYDAPEGTVVDLRVSRDGGRSFGPFFPAEITWSEGLLHVAHADLPTGTTHVQVRFGVDSPEEVSFLVAELFVYEPEPWIDLSLDDTRIRTQVQGLAVDSADVTRAQWGARTTYCSSTHTPNRITIHHTVSPNDGGDMAARVRQIQAYHIDTRGWCDIGYHFLVGQDGKVYEGRKEQLIGAHVGGHNTNNAGVSFIGTFTQVPPAETMFDAGGRIVKALSDTYGIPLDRNRVKGHREYKATACPGDQLYSRLQYLIDVAQGISGGGSATGTLTGVVFWGTDFDTDKSDPAKRIAGATVTLSTGESTTTNSNGYYTFDLEPGTYTVTAKATGYSTESVTRTVSSGETRWGSIMLSPVAAGQGTVKGYVVYGASMDEFDDAVADASRRVPGATVTFTPGGETVQTDATGYYEVRLSAGTYEITAAAEGYLEGGRPDPVVVVEGDTVWASALVIEPDRQDGEPPEVRIEAPVDGLRTGEPQVVVRGTVTDSSPVVRVEVAGTPAPLSPSGAFEAVVELTPGENLIEVEAEDAAGNVGGKRVTVVYDPALVAVTGFVYDADGGEERRIEGAHVSLVADAAFETQTDATGSFRLYVAPGTWRLLVQAEGYRDHEETVDVNEAPVLLRVGLGMATGVQPTDAIEITYPAEGERVRTEEIMVTGRVLVAAVTSVRVAGVGATFDSETGGFAAKVRLEPGANTLEIGAFERGKVLATKAVTVFYEPAGCGCAAASDGTSSGPSVVLLAALVVGVLRRSKARPHRSVKGPAPWR